MQMTLMLWCRVSPRQRTDENQTHRGTEEIKTWAQDVRRKSDFKTEILRSAERPNGAVVTAKLSGNFPGGSARLRLAR